MATLYIFIVMLCRVVQSIYGKRTALELRTLRSFIGFQAVRNAIAALLGLALVLLSGKGLYISLNTLWIGALSGLCITLSGACSNWAIHSATIPLCNIFGTAGIFFPILFGLFFLNQPMHWMQWCGVGIFMISAVLLIGSSKKIYCDFRPKTLFLLIGILVFEGFTMLCQQLFTTLEPNGDIAAFSFVSFGTIVVLSPLTLFLFRKETNGQKTSPIFSKKLLPNAIFLAVCIFLINQLITLCTTMISPVILFTISSVGHTIISTAVAAIVYKERLTFRSVLGIILGVGSALLIKFFEV